MGHHPAHPATVHLPIALTLLTGLLDTLYYTLTHPSTATPALSLYTTLSLDTLPPSILPTLSYHTTRLLLLTAFPAVITGAWELMPLIQKQGFGAMKTKAAVLHAFVNDLTVFGALWNWWSRRGREGFVPTGGNVFLSAGLAVPGTVFAAWIGGQLVYQYGMGVGRGSNVKPKKVE